MYEITTGILPDIDFAPKSVEEEILQNIRCILSTTKCSVPLDRDFGIDASFVDKPMETAKAKLAAEIIMAIAKYEPRAVVSNINWISDPDGILRAKVQVEINEV